MDMQDYYKMIQAEAIDNAIRTINGFADDISEEYGRKFAEYTKKLSMSIVQSMDEDIKETYIKETNIEEILSRITAVTSESYAEEFVKEFLRDRVMNYALNYSLGYYEGRIETIFEIEDKALVAKLLCFPEELYQEKKEVFLKNIKKY